MALAATLAVGVAIAVFAVVALTPISAAAPPSASRAEATAEAARRQRLAAVATWGYQLRRLVPAEIAASPFDLVVIDYAPDRYGGVEVPFTRAEVAAMQVKPEGVRRVVLAYLSIGEAEWYRLYWRRDWDATPPAWLGPMNPRWYGNFPVRFWDPGWQALLSGRPDAYLDRILAAGFDGIYLDRADVYEEWSKERPSAAGEMAELIGRLSRYARARDPGFLVVMQNAEELLERADMRRILDGVAKEDLFYGIAHDEAANDAGTVAWSLRLLRQMRRAGKPVLHVEYLTEPARIADAVRRARAEGFLPYLGPRDLGRLVTEQPHLPTVPPAKGARAGP